MSDLKISEHVKRCSVSFIDLTSALERNQAFTAQLRPAAVSNEFDRFKIWAGNVAAHRRGSISLDYRLRDAAHLRDRTQDLLRSLKEALCESLAIISGRKVPWDELSDSESESESSLDLGQLVQNNPRGNTELKQLHTIIGETITCLFRLSISFRDPASQIQLRHTVVADKSYFETFDIAHVRGKFPLCREFLIDRLGRAISARRQYLTYREEHHKRLAKGVEHIGAMDSQSEHSTNTTEATPLPASNPTDHLLELDGASDATSFTSFATSVNATLRCPSLPKEGCDGKPFECPLCYMMVSIDTPRAWRQHVYHDLHPYSCTYQDCRTPDRLFSSRHEWLRHEKEAHQIVWQCIEPCRQVFNSDHQLIHHVQQYHPDIDNTAFPALQRSAARGSSDMGETVCPLCQQRMILRRLQKHLGHHQEQLALFALPNNLTEREDECSSSDIDSKIAHDESPAESLSAAGSNDEFPENGHEQDEGWLESSFGGQPRGSDGESTGEQRQPTSPNATFNSQALWRHGVNQIFGPMNRGRRPKKFLSSTMQRSRSQGSEPLPNLFVHDSMNREEKSQQTQNLHTFRNQSEQDSRPNLDNKPHEHRNLDTQSRLPSDPDALTFSSKQSQTDEDHEQREQNIEEMTEAMRKLPARIPTLTKVHKNHLSVETLRYFNLPWEWDRTDKDYLIILEEISPFQTEELFEHTRSVRDRAMTSRLAHSQRLPDDDSQDRTKSSTSSQVLRRFKKGSPRDRFY